MGEPLALKGMGVVVLEPEGLLLEVGA